MAGDLIVTAVDTDVHAVEVVRVATELAADRGAGLLLVHVLPIGKATHPDVLHNPAAHPVAAKHMREHEAKVVPDLKRLVAQVRAATIPVRLSIAHGDAAEAILAVADDEGAAMVVLGTRGLKGLARLALGSVADAVVRAARVPVVCVPAKPPKD